MSGANIHAPKLDINGNIVGATINTPKVDINGPNININKEMDLNNPSINLRRSQGIKLPNIEITDPKIGGNFVGDINTNIPNNFDPKAEIKPLDLKVEGGIKPINLDNCYDAQGNFCFTGIIPSKNDNNINNDINNLSMSNLLLLQGNRIDNKLSRTRLESSNINQSIMNTNHLNTDINNNKRFEMNINLGGGLNTVQEDQKVINSE